MNSSVDVLHSWLNHQASLMDKLKSIASDVHLEVLNHGWSQPDIWDKTTLHILSEDMLLRREIIMWAGSHACWYARTIIPKDTFDQEQVLFNRLREEPLGELIWGKNQFKRESLFQYAIDKQSLEYHFLTPDMHQNFPSLWARLSKISVHRSFQLHLLEIFLPDLQHHLL